MILSMAQPYVKNGAIMYNEFDRIFSDLSLREQYNVVEILFRNGIELTDEHPDKNELILELTDEPETNPDYDGDEFDILYDESIFKDKNTPNSGFDDLVLNKTVKQSNEILCSLIKQGNRQAMQDLCVKNKALVDKYAAAYHKRYGNRLDFEDLEQVGFLGLTTAAQKFSIQLGYAFSTYAVSWIRQSILREIMDHGYAIRIPVHMMEKINKVVAASNRFPDPEMSFHTRASLIAAELKMNEDEVRECLALKKNYLTYTSLDVPVGEDGDSELGELIPDESAENVEDALIKKELRRELDKALKALPAREREVLELRFGWNDGKSRTLEEIGEQFHVTRERIRQIEDKALRKIRKRQADKSKSIRAFLEE